MKKPRAYHKRKKSISWLFVACCIFAMVFKYGDKTIIYNKAYKEANKILQTAEEKRLESYDMVTIINVIDGDTIECSFEDGTKKKIRLIGVDCPESVNPDKSKNTSSGKSASEYTKRRLYEGLKVYLEYDKEKTDKYGRTLAYMWLKDPPFDKANITFVSAYMYNAELLFAGQAVPMRIEPNTAYADIFEEIFNNGEE